MQEKFSEFSSRIRGTHDCSWTLISISLIPYYYYGKLLSKKGGERVGETVEKLRKAVALNPAFPDAHYELGKALAQAGQTAQAIQQLERSLDLKPSLAQSHYQLGVIYRTLGDQSQSAEQFRLFEAASKKSNPKI